MRMKILIVENEPDLVEAMQYGLEASGYNVISACDGLTGLNLAKNELPDLIILDVHMPKMDGFHICRMLKFDNRYEHIPIIILTGRDKETDAKIIDDIKVDVYMNKPFEMSALLLRVNELLSQ